MCLNAFTVPVLPNEGLRIAVLNSSFYGSSNSIVRGHLLFRHCPYSLPQFRQGMAQDAICLHFAIFPQAAGHLDQHLPQHSSARAGSVLPPAHAVAHNVQPSAQSAYCQTAM